MILKALYYILIGVFSLFIARTVLLKLFNLKLVLIPFKFDFKAKRYLLFIIIASIITFFVISFLFDKIRNNYYRDLNTQFNNEEILLSDSALFIQKEKVNAILQLEKEKEEIILLLQKYYDAYCKNDFLVLDTFYVYPLEKYYTYSPASKNTVHERTSFELRHNSYPDCKISPDKVEIKKVGNDSTEISILLSKSTNTIKYYTIIKLDRQRKIFYVANTILTPYYEDDPTLKKSKKRKQKQH